jgi:hypothetical protein
MLLGRCPLAHDSYPLQARSFGHSMTVVTNSMQHVDEMSHGGRTCAVKEFILACAIADLPVVVCAALACPMPRLRASVLIATSHSGRLMADHDDEPATCSLPTRSDTSLIQGAGHGKAVCHVALLFNPAHITR